MHGKTRSKGTINYFLESIAMGKEVFKAKMKKKTLR